MRFGTKEEKAAYAREYRTRPAIAQRIRARSMLSQAIKSGRLVPLPCEKCGKPKTDGHHDDYSKPLDIRWLCRSCHGEAHRKTHCKRGHALTPDNIRLSRGGRECKTCRHNQRRAQITRDREAAAQTI